MDGRRAGLTAQAPPAAEGPGPSAGGLRVSQLRIHPVKGAAGVGVDALEFDSTGPRFDRRWMAVGPDGEFLTQRETPGLALVRPRLGADVLELRGPDGETVELPVAFDGPPLRVRVWGSEVDARAGPPAGDEWLSERLGRRCRLVHLGEDGARATDPAYAEGHRVGFADGYPVLVVGEGSVSELARRAGRPIPVDRFRPNIVVSGTAPHDEDAWRRFVAGDLALRGVKLCARCKVTTIEQDLGTVDPDSEPLRTLARYRRIKGHVYFGLNAVHHGADTVRAGDPVEVLERGTIPGAWR